MQPTKYTSRSSFLWCPLAHLLSFSGAVHPSRWRKSAIRWWAVVGALRPLLGTSFAKTVSTTNTHFLGDSPCRSSKRQAPPLGGDDSYLQSRLAGLPSGLFGLQSPLLCLQYRLYCLQLDFMACNIFFIACKLDFMACNIFFGVLQEVKDIDTLIDSTPITIFSANHHDSVSAAVSKFRYRNCRNDWACQTVASSSATAAAGKDTSVVSARILAGRETLIRSSHSTLLDQAASSRDHQQSGAAGNSVRNQQRPFRHC
jgi:hypothetical protein